MKTVYQQISQNKLKSYVIFFIFIVIFSGFFYLIGQFYDSPHTYLLFGLIISSLSAITSYFYSDKIVLFTVGAKPANKKDHFDFFTVTENLAIASGLPMPKLYVIDDPSPNAFATGRDPNHAVVCVTTGLLKILDRSDLEGVIAHELSHIKNYDILLSSIVAVLVGTISLIADWILRSWYWHSWSWQRRDSQRKSENPFLYLVFILALIIAPIIATLIQLAISRRREYLADASAILLTRNKMGLIDALRKISQCSYSLKTATTSTAHLFFVNPFKSRQHQIVAWLTNLFSTHPPIEARIKALMEL